MQFDIERFRKLRYNVQGVKAMDMTNTVDTVIRTLNRISVSGRQNLDMLLGSMIALERLRNELAERESAVSVDVKEGEDSDADH